MLNSADGSLTIDGQNELPEIFALSSNRKHVHKLVCRSGRDDDERVVQLFELVLDSELIPPLFAFSICQARRQRINLGPSMVFGTAKRVTLETPTSRQLDLILPPSAQLHGSGVLGLGLHMALQWPDCPRLSNVTASR